MFHLESRGLARTSFVGQKSRGFTPTPKSFGVGLRSEQGFTLVELLVTIGIIGILSSVVLASLGTARSNARDARRISDIKQLQLALELYNDKFSTYPTALNAANLVNTGFIASVPVDPSSGLSYGYAALGTGATCTSYHIGAKLEKTTSATLNSDSDYTDVASSQCTNGTWAGNADIVALNGGFAGTDPVYDLRP